MNLAGLECTFQQRKPNFNAITMSINCPDLALQGNYPPMQGNQRYTAKSLLCHSFYICSCRWKLDVSQACLPTLCKGKPIHSTLANGVYSLQNLFWFSPPASLAYLSLAHSPSTDHLEQCFSGLIPYCCARFSSTCTKIPYRSLKYTRQIINYIELSSRNLPPPFCQSLPQPPTIWRLFQNQRFFNTYWIQTLQINGLEFHRKRKKNDWSQSLKRWSGWGKKLTSNKK